MILFARIVRVFTEKLRKQTAIDRRRRIARSRRISTSNERDTSSLHGRKTRVDYSSGGGGGGRRRTECDLRDFAQF